MYIVFYLLHEEPCNVYVAKKTLSLLLLLFRKKPKMSKFGTKNALFGYFGVRFLKNYRHI